MTIFRISNCLKAPLSANTLVLLLMNFTHLRWISFPTPVGNKGRGDVCDKVILETIRQDDIFQYNLWIVILRVKLYDNVVLTFQYSRVSHSSCFLWLFSRCRVLGGHEFIITIARKCIYLRHELKVLFWKWVELHCGCFERTERTERSAVGFGKRTSHQKRFYLKIIYFVSWGKAWL